MLPVLNLLFAASLWGIVWYPLRLLEQQGLGGLWSVAISYGAALLVCSWLLIRLRQQLWQHWAPLILMSLAAGWCNVAFILAVLDGHVVRVLLLFYLAPFWAVCLGWLMLGERLDKRSLPVFIIAVSGAIIMLWNEEVGLPMPADTADWLAVSSGFAFALSNVYVRKLQAVDVWLKSTSSWIGVVLIALAWIVLGDVPLPAVSGTVVIYAVLLGLFGFLLMTVTVQYGVTHMPVHRSAIILLFELVVGAVSSMLLTDEQVLPREWLGGLMIVTAAWLAARLHAGETDE
jgi:drug/metabolite transporter (DMT)-like permease